MYTDPNSNVISARRELVEEFYLASEGHSICIVHPSVFIKSYNPSADTEVIQDLAKNEKERSLANDYKVLEMIRDRARILFNKNILPEHDIPTKRYIVGEHGPLDILIRMLQDNDEEDLLFEVLRKADFIASTEDIDEEERTKRYRKLAIRGLNNLNDHLNNE